MIDGRHTGNRWRIGALALLSGSAVIALISADWLLIAAVASGIGGLALLSMPMPAVRSSGASAHRRRARSSVRAVAHWRAASGVFARRQARPTADLMGGHAAPASLRRARGLP